MRSSLLGGLALATVIGCGSSVFLYPEGDGGGTATGGSGGTVTFPGTSSTSVGEGGGGGLFVPSTGVTTGPGGQGAGGEICASVGVETTVDKAPADIVFVVDNSGSMSEEIEAVEQNINVNFANVMAAAALDYRVIMLTNHGPNPLDLCIGPPLSSGGDCNGAPGETTQFFHYDIDVQSHNSLCVILETLKGGGLWSDQQGLHPNGWLPLLRPEALKFFIEITDDQVDCTFAGIPLDADATSAQLPDPGKAAAQSFDIQLTGQSPLQFGTPFERRYKFYSIVGVAPNNPASVPYSSDDPFVVAKCNTAISNAPGYQWLSIGSGGYRFPVCEFGDYGPIFEQIANDVLVTTAIPCSIPLPAEPEGEEFDLDAVEVAFSPSPSSPPTTFTQVAGVGSCTPGNLEFYVEGDAMELCPEACAIVSSGNISNGEVNVDVRCKTAP